MFLSLIGKHGFLEGMLNRGAESACGWCRDMWGLSWQITPRVLTEVGAGEAAKRAFKAMMEMNKIDVARIEAAVRGS
jgi:predicted 3-demethylubiquinone-9 3-methyltransferase (glyoxalase superfamily)